MTEAKQEMYIQFRAKGLVKYRTRGTSEKKRNTTILYENNKNHSKYYVQ